jgi:hypothetical protein
MPIQLIANSLTASFAGKRSIFLSSRTVLFCATGRQDCFLARGAPCNDGGNLVEIFPNPIGSLGCWVRPRLGPPDAIPAAARR